MSSEVNSGADHSQAINDLEAGRPGAALMIWRQLLTSDEDAVRRHLSAAEATLSRDAIAPIRRRAINLINNLLSHCFWRTY